DADAPGAPPQQVRPPVGRRGLRAGRQVEPLSTRSAPVWVSVPEDAEHGLALAVDGEVLIKTCVLNDEVRDPVGRDVVAPERERGALDGRERGLAVGLHL